MSNKGKYIARKWTLPLKSSSYDTLALQDFKLVEEDLFLGEDAVLSDGEILVEALYISPDPYIRAGGLEGKPFLVGEALKGVGDNGIPGSQVGRILLSTHPHYPPSTIIYGFFGWRNLTRYRIPVHGNSETFSCTGVYKLPTFFDGKTIPYSYALGVGGMPGVTAFYAVEKILEIPDNSSNKTLVVSTATGAVGNLVLQVGKLKGCKTLVFTSTDEKVIWLKTLGAGYIFNYNKIDPDAVFKEYASEGIDYYFDNIGGTFTYHVINHMKPHGRIAVCDAISCYEKNANSVIKTVPFDYLTVVDKRIRIEGFSVYEDLDEGEWLRGVRGMIFCGGDPHCVKGGGWVSEGKIKVEETIVEGFENMPQAFIDRFEGRVVGVQVIKVK